MVRNCKVCGIEFNPRGPQVLCSKECRRKQNTLKTRQRPGRQQPSWRLMRCPECDVEFSTKSKLLKTCGSNRCKYERAYRNRSAEYIENEKIRHRKWHAETVGAERARQRELLAPIKAEAKLKRKRVQSKIRYQQLKEQTCKCVYESTLKSYDKGICRYCKQREAVEWDHIVPIAVGGKHCYNNLAPICKHCNRGWKRVAWNKVLTMNIQTPFKCTQAKENT